MSETGASIDVLLELVIAKIQLDVAGTMQDGKLQRLYGTATLSKTLSAFLDDAQSDFAPAGTVLRKLIGNSTIKLDHAAVAFYNSDPKFLQLIVTFSAGKNRCRFALFHQSGTQGGYIGGLELQLDNSILQNNPLSGLTGDISIGNLGIYFASNDFQHVPYDAAATLPSAQQVLPPSQRSADLSKGRKFTRGLNWSAQISFRGKNLFEALRDPGTSTLPPPSSGTAEPPQPPDTTSWIELDKSLGPLTFKRVGFRFLAPQGDNASPRVAIRFDAGLQLSVLTLTLEGLGLSYPLDKISDLTKPAKFFGHLQFQLDGASLSLQRGPLTISGALLKVEKEYLQLDGVLLVRTSGFTLAAIGSYANISGTHSLFAFAILDKPLGGPPFFFVTGLAFGFGVNRELKIPPIGQVPNFPLVRAASDPGYFGDKLDIRRVSQSIEEYLAPSPGNFWLAAGVRFTSFGQLESTALLTISFGAQLQIALLGLSRLQVPRAPAPAIVSAELALKIAFTLESGLMSFEASLTENSYILAREFKLRGGFAFYVWFGGEHAGDFVISLGGYHPRFQPPAHYPRPDLVEFNARMGPITIQGRCYFALCPAAVMVGAGLSILFEAGPIKAWFIAAIDFLLQWKPLLFDIYIAIFVGVALRLGGDGARSLLSIELGASINLYGPSLGGEAKISLWIITFTIRFGADKYTPPPLVWKSEDEKASFPKSFLHGAITQTLVGEGLLEEVRYAEADGRDAATQFVNPHRLLVSCHTQIPLTEAKYNDKLLSSLTTTGWNTQVGIRPMDRREFYSRMEVELSPANVSDEDKEQMQAYLDQYIEIVPATKGLPRAIWDTKPLDPNIVPDEQTVKNALVGLTIRTKPGPRPWETPVMQLETLKFDREQLCFPYAAVTSTAGLPAQGPKQLYDNAVAKCRASILAALQQSGRRITQPVSDTILTGQLEKVTLSLFRAMPVMARPGQYPPRGFLDI